VKTTPRLSTWRSVLAVFGAAMLMYILLSSSYSSTSNSSSSSNSNSGALTIRSNVSIQATTTPNTRSVVGATITSATTTIDSNNLSNSDGNNDPNSVVPSSSLRVAAGAAGAIVTSGEGKMGSCRTTGSTIPYNGGHQTFGEPLYDLDFRASSYANRAWQDKKYVPTFDEAWQACALQCNNEDKCHTYTVHIDYPNPNKAVIEDCYLHDSYKSGYKLHKNELPPAPSINRGSLLYVSGVCRLNNE